jgi:hypothetical protein
MMMFEDFIVEVPMCSGFSKGDVVQPNIHITLRSDVVLRKGLVVKVDTEPSQRLLPLFFVIGLSTRIRSPLRLGVLERSEAGIASFKTEENLDFLDSFEPNLAHAYNMLLCSEQADLVQDVKGGEEEK